MDMLVEKKNVCILSLIALLCVVLVTPAVARESLSSLRTDVNAAQDAANNAQADADTANSGVSANAADINRTQNDVTTNTSDIEVNSDAICELACAMGVDIVFCTCPTKTVFATSTAQNGNLGGMTGADALCQSLANAASLEGTYLAWLSDSTGSPITRFTQATVPYVRVDGTVIADDWADLTDGDIQAPINIDETGAIVSGNAWSNTDPDGSKTAKDISCADWTRTFFVPGAPETGFVGNTIQTNGTWTLDVIGLCPGAARLYCFEQ